MPDDWMVYGFLVDASAELGNYKESEKAAQWMLDLSRGGIPALTRTAYLREMFGDVEGALELMSMAYKRIDPLEVEDRAWTLVQIGHLYAVAGKLDEARSALNQALELMPEYHYALAGLAKVRSEQGARDEAVRLMKRRFALAPHPENLFDVAVELHGAGKRAEASKAFAEFEKLALAESRNLDNANRELIAYYADYAKRPTQALRIAEMEIARRRDVATLDAWAWALHRAGRQAEARAAIEEALGTGTVDRKIRTHAKAITQSGL
jgi:tetratricopeptide (TPR) repeat protein